MIKLSAEAQKKIDDFIEAATDEELKAIHSKACKETRRRNPRPSLFSEEQKQFVRENYNKMSNAELAEIFGNADQSRVYSKHTIGDLIRKLGLRRTEQDLQAILRRCQEKGVFAAAAKRAGQTMTKHQIGDVYEIEWHGKMRKVIKIAHKKYKWYAQYVWEQAYGPVLNHKWIVIIDESKPIEISNLQLQDKPSINSFYLGAKYLDDWFIINTLTKGKNAILKDKIKEMPALIEQQRKAIQLKRIINEENKKLEGPATGNDQQLL